MKYIAFALAIVVGIPGMMMVSIIIPKIKYLLVSLMIFTTMLGAG